MLFTGNTFLGFTSHSLTCKTDTLQRKNIFYYEIVLVSSTLDTQAVDKKARAIQSIVCAQQSEL